MSYRLLASNCTDGDCPSIWLDETTGDVICRGADATDPTVERDVRYPAGSPLASHIRAGL